MSPEARKETQGSYILAAGRVVLGGVMIYAAIHKIDDPAMFAQTVRAYDILPLPLVHPFAVVVPWMEALGGALLLAGLWTRGAALVTLGLLCAFGVAIGVNIARGADMACGCFGVGGGGGTLGEAAVRDGVLVVVAGGVLIGGRTALALDGWAERWRPEDPGASREAAPTP